MINLNGYWGFVQQSGPGVFITKPARLAVIRAGEGQEARHLYIALLGRRTQLDLDYDINKSRLTTEIRPNTPDTYIDQASYLLQQQAGYVAINGPEEIDGIFLRTPDADLDKYKGLEGIVEILSILEI
ncbi:hypothetical protein HYX04_00775 [Candidatus Woesearchaeota archaeon]|nr:hypothetical protein [Candidatus Woesearchaeota archaeon]